MPHTVSFDSTGVFNNALAVSGNFSIRWLPGVKLDPATFARAEVDNVQLLAAEASLEESAAADMLKDESPQVALELHRIELKLNILLKLTGELLARDQQLPEPRFARLSASGLDCVADAALKVGEQGTLELFVNRALPYALKFHALAESEHTEKGLRFVQLRFLDMSQPAADQLAKLIFRRHRRIIALARQHTQHQD
jgi:Atypical PilZ domain, cyclic di-GMP receptor